jgi:RNA polymerase primary sigma factor
MRQLKISRQITNRENESFNKYLNEVSKIPMVSMEEEILLAKRIREGDQLALEKLVRGNLRFVISIAKKYQHLGMPLVDIVNEGNLGLIKAASKFDESRGFKFISYAVWWIRQSIILSVSQNSRIVRVPYNKIADNSKILNGISLLEQKYEREPTSEELSELLEIDLEEVNDVIQHFGKSISLDAPLKDDDSTSLSDLINDPHQKNTDHTLLEDSLKIDLERALYTLPERKAEVLKLYFGIDGSPLGLEDIGKKLNLGRERVRQIKDEAIKNLRAMPNIKRILSSI